MVSVFQGRCAQLTADALSFLLSKIDLSSAGDNSRVEPRYGVRRSRRKRDSNPRQDPSGAGGQRGFMLRAGSFLQRPGAVFVLLFALIFFRYTVFGFQYYPQLDDYIQYHNYGLSAEPLRLILQQGLLAARPLAGVLDVLFWSRFWSVMILAVALISALWAASALLFRQVLSRYFPTGFFFLIVYTLFPLGMEGTYWLSASTRIVCGMFFCALSVRLFQSFLDRGGLRLLLWLPVFVLSLGFYEQTFVLSFALICLLSLFHLRGNRARAFCGAFILPAAAFYFFFTHLFADSATYAARSTLILPVSRYYLDTFLPELIGQFRRVFLGGGWHIMARGFCRGIELLVSSSAVWYLPFLLALCVIVYLTASRQAANRPAPPVGSAKPKKQISLYGSTASQAFWGLLLALVPLAPFFVIGTPWFSMRGAVPSFLGLGCLADAALTTVLRSLPQRKRIAAVLSAACAFVFCCAAVAEIADYKETAENDSAIVRLLCEEDAALAGTGGNIGVLNLNPSYLKEQNYFYHEHIHGVTESAWALKGAMTAYRKGDTSAAWTPLPLSSDGTVWQAWNSGSSRISLFDRLYYLDYESMRLVPLVCETVSENEWLLYREDGSLLARIWETDKCGYYSLP